MHTFPSGPRGQLLRLIKQHGSIGLDQAEASVGLSRATLRQHLSILERDGMVVRSSERSGRGRPSIRFSLAEAAGALFPSRHGMLLGGLLDLLIRRGETALIEEFFAEFWSLRLREASARMDAADPHDAGRRMAALGEFLAEQGFMPEITQDSGRVVIRECNCPFPEVVKRTRIPCRLEAGFFEGVFGVKPERVSFIPDGVPACTYELRLAAGGVGREG